jgi:hypothetical protein
MTETRAAVTDEVAEQLEALAENLRGRGFSAHVSQVGRYACVNVANVAVRQLAETVYVADADGAWWFWWSWADRITRISEVETAAFKIAYVLTPGGHG